ncbi:penicillin-binding transpeptidase domain-containing protein [Streptomyces sp. NPDC001606]
MQKKIIRAVVVPGLLAALGATLAGCSQGTAKTAEKHGSSGLGNILVDGRAVTGSRPSGIAKVPYRRTYTDGALYAPVTGYRSMAFGRAGLEAVYDDVLSAGTSPGGVSGDVLTTVDGRAQRAAFDALGKEKGAAVALDVRTGAVLALVSTPSYDPGAFSGNLTTDVGAWHKVTRDADDPLLNRPLREATAPGATFHLVVAAAALEQGLYTSVDQATHSPLVFAVPGTTARIGGGSPRCAKASLRTALRLACSNVFAKLAADLGHSRLRATAERLGFGDDALRIPVRATPSVYPADPRSAGQTALTGNGADVTVTALESARISAAVADGGRAAAAHLVARVRPGNGGNTRPGLTSAAAGQVLSRHTADQLRSALGTGSGGVTGLTGWTTLAGHTRSWFTGYGQDGDGRLVAVAVWTEAAIPGGTATDDGTPAGPAARVAGRILAALS